MIILNQCDKRWGWKPLGKSSETICKSGCVITGISMLSDWAKDYKDPAYLAKNLNFTKEGYLYWNSINNKTPLKFVWRGYPSNFKQSQVDEALKSKDGCILLNVMGGKHWVVGIYRVPFTNRYWVADPLSSTRKFYSGVIGYAILEKK